ncbi:MAG: efflux RND transporter permease subunit [Blastocatellia bacterium]
MLTVTHPLEEAIRNVPGITNVRSITGRGSSEISVIFRWGVDILNALHLIHGKIAQIAPRLSRLPGVAEARITCIHSIRNKAFLPSGRKLK